MKVLLIDGFNLIRRLYEARPHDDETLDPEVITGSCQSLQRALRQHQPSHVALVFDSPEKTWRHELYPEYKANRKPTPPPLLSAIPQFEQAFNNQGVKTLTIDAYEADDVIATLAHGLDKANKNITILSTDKNFLQLNNENISIYDHFNEKAYDGEYVVKKYNVTVDQLLDYWALTGDSTGNIKGVPKVGPKTASQLIQTYQSLENMLKSDSDDKHIARVKEYQQEAKLAYELMSLKTNLKLGVNLNELRYLT